MATENDKGKGKEVEPEQEKIADETDPKTKSKWFGRYHNGEWYCHCKDGDRKAVCRTLTRVDRDDYGKAFWICPKGKGKGQCTFFILAEEEGQVREWLAGFGSAPPPELPTPKSPATPWTLSKRSSKRKAVPRENLNQDPVGGPSSQKIDENQDLYYAGSPSSKVAKVTRLDNPGQTFRDRLMRARERLPTPDTGEKDTNDAPASSSSQPLNGTPTRTQLRPAIGLTRDGEDEEEGRSTLSDVVIELLREENEKFNDITELLVRDAINTETKAQDVRMKGSKGTIRRLRNKIDELKSKADILESTLLLLTGSQTAELSD